MAMREPAAPPGDYSLLTKIASGGMATVYVGRKSGAAGFERLVAIKCCHPHLRDNEDFASMFLDEARLAAGIRHPNVAATLDVSDGELLYLVMEYVEGPTLGNLFREAARTNTQIPPPVAVRVMIDVLSGLHAAHELRNADGELLGLVHRDVSPQNVLVSVNGIARITDFGIAFASARSTQTQEGIIKGKFAYIAPEQVTGKQMTRRMDVFSAGAVLWEALTGRALFRRQDDAATIHAVLREAIPLPSSVTRGIPRALDAVILKALQRDPDARYATAAEFADALERVRMPGVTSRSVANYVEASFGAVLSQRREEIRKAPERPLSSLVRDPTHTSGGTRKAYSGTDPSRSAEIVLDSVVSNLDDASGLRSGETIEHRRMRGVLAAAMLILVGGALGLLLARSAQPPAHAAQPAPTVTEKSH